MNDLPIELVKEAVCVYPLGSFVYGTNDELSDRDYIFVFNEPRVSDNINNHYYTVEEFQSLLDNCDIQMLECHFLPPGVVIKQRNPWTFTLDKQKLRKSISTISSNSWVKGKKKLIVTGDYDLRAGLKSIYHSLRILDYGIQICQHGEIVYWDRMNFILKDIKKLSEQYSRVELWEKIDNKYRKTFNTLSSTFKTLAPKDTRDAEKKKEIEELLAKYGINNVDLLTELTAIL